jgi:hypothetical protein
MKRSKPVFDRFCYFMACRWKVPIRTAALFKPLWVGVPATPSPTLPPIRRSGRRCPFNTASDSSAVVTPHSPARRR